jgi:hypothetical protein
VPVAVRPVRAENPVRVGAGCLYWHGIQLVAGNLYVLTGLALFVLLVLTAVRGAAVRRRRRTTAPAACTEPAVAAGPSLR